MQTISHWLVIVLIIVVCKANLFATQDAEISFQSSSNFKAMEGYGFDMTCQLNDSGNHSIEFFLPDGKRAVNIEYATIGPPSWNKNAVEMKILKAVKSRDEGLYKCVVDGSIKMENHVEFVVEPFLNLSTPNRIIKMDYKKVSELQLVVDFIALPYPNFYMNFEQTTTDNLVQRLNHKNFQVNSNRLIIPLKLEVSDIVFWIFAKNTELVTSLVFKLEGQPIMKANIYLNYVPTVNYESSWKKIDNAELFDHFATYDKIVQYKWSEGMDKNPTHQHWQIETVSNPTASVVAWIFQPCFNMTTCTSLKDLVNTAEIIGGMKSTIIYKETHDIVFYSKSPGYVYIYVENAHGVEKLKIGYNFEFMAKLSAISKTIFWNPHLERDEILIGENLILECQSVPIEKIDWNFGPRDIYGTNFIFSDILRLKHITIQRMEIKNIHEKDEGMYSCGSSFKRGNHYFIKLIEPEAPRIISAPSSTFITRNYGPVELQCEVEEEMKSITSFLWYKNGQPLNDANRNLTKLGYGRFKITLSIENFVQSDAGNYSCKAVNNFGKDERFVFIEYQNNRHFIIGGLVISLIFILIMFAFYIRVHLAKKEILELKAAGLANFEEGNLESFNKLLGLNEQADLLPYDPRFEFPIEKLTLHEQLGSGAFGVVYKAIAQGIKPMENETIVAVKTINKLAPNEMLKALVVELKIMVHMGQHLNIVNLLGAITKNIAKRDLMVISEYCCYGDLEGFLRKYRSSFKNIDQVNSKATVNCEPQQYMNIPNYSTPTVSFKTSNLISWSFQVACGMDYLASKKVLHGDLAARNVLLCTGDVIKISDFGLAKSLYQNYVYQRKDDALLPYKWLALECLIDNTFSVYSDIWAYGILVWEIFTLGQTPYPEVFGIEPLLNKLQSGYRLTKPEFSSQAIYEIMLDCWRVEKKQRPAFTDLVHRFGDLILDSVKNHLIALNEPFFKANLESIRNGRIDFATLLIQDSDNEPASLEENINNNAYETLVMRGYLKPDTTG